MTKTRVTATASALLLIVILIQAAAATSTVRDTLEERVEFLEQRVERLETRALMHAPEYFDDELFEQLMAGEYVPSDEWRLPDHVMMVDGMDLVDVAPDDGRYDQIDKLTREADALDKTIHNLERELANRRDSGGSARRGNWNRYDGSNKLSKQNLLKRYKAEQRRKRQEAERLRKQIEEPKQIITGHWDERLIILTTTRDLSGGLAEIDPGDGVTWRGRRILATSDREEWIVTSITRLDPPE